MLTEKERREMEERLSKMTEEEAYQNALSDPDNPPLTDEELKEFRPMKDIPGNTIFEKLQYLRKLKENDIKK